MKSVGLCHLLLLSSTLGKILMHLIKNVNSFTPHKKTPSLRLYVFPSLGLYVCLYGNLRKFFLTLSFGFDFDKKKKLYECLHYE